MLSADYSQPDVTHRNFLVTTAITNSWAKALIKNVINIAVERDVCQPLIDGAYMCRKRNVWTGLFHLRENSSQDVEFHLKQMGYWYS